MHLDFAKVEQRTQQETKPLTVAVLALPEVLPLDFGIPLQVLGRNTGGLYQVQSCAEDRQEVASIGGFTIKADSGLELLEQAHTVIVPGYTQSREQLSPAVKEALQAAHLRGARTVSICTGAFALAQAGVLDGLKATTHWQSAQDLGRMFPKVDVDPNVLFVDNGNVVTSAGVAAGIDLCLHLIREDFGASESNQAARKTVAAPRRQGSQAQFIHRPAEPAVAADQSALAAVIEWSLRNLHTPISLLAMSRAGAISQRTLHRKFTQNTGHTPLRWVNLQRIERAKELLESSQLSIDQIAQQVGAGSGANFRSIFKTATSLTPSAYRSSFQS